MTPTGPGVPDQRAFDWPDDCDWRPCWDAIRQSDWFRKLQKFVAGRRRVATVFPEPENVFRAMQLTPLARVRFVILGQDPYHGDGQADGLSFSVPAGVPNPPSLRNILAEWSDDTGFEPPENGDLSGWARQGGLMLNTVLTVDRDRPNSHRHQGWEQFSDQVISSINHRCEHVVFVLWGKSAQQKKTLINADRHLVLESAHPSPLSAWRGFFGSRPFSRINRYRTHLGLPEVDWRI